MEQKSTDTHGRGSSNDTTPDFPSSNGHSISKIGEGRKGGRGGRYGQEEGRPNNPQVIAVLGRPTYTEFLGLEDTHIGAGGTLELGAIQACAVLREHFAKKEALMARVNFMLYQVKRSFFWRTQESDAPQCSHGLHVAQSDRYSYLNAHAFFFTVWLLSLLGEPTTGQSE